MVTNIKWVICSFVAFSMLSGSVSEVHAGIKDVFRTKNTSATMSKSMQRKIKRNAKEYYDDTHKEERKIEAEAHKRAIKQAIKNLEANAQIDFLKILDNSDRELKVDSIINICGEFKLIAKKLEFLKNLKDVLIPDSFTALKQELMEELQDVYYTCFQKDNPLFKQYQNAYDKINSKFSSKVDNLDEESTIDEILSIANDINDYLEQYINDFIYKYEDANAVALKQLLEARRNEEITKYNKSKNYESKTRKPGGVSDEDIRNLSNEHMSSIREAKIQAMI